MRTGGTFRYHLLFKRKMDKMKWKEIYSPIPTLASILFFILFKFFDTTNRYNIKPMHNIQKTKHSTLLMVLNQLNK